MSDLEGFEAPAIITARRIGWSDTKISLFEEQFLEFLSYVRVDSKELGNICLGDHVYRSQKIFLDGVLEALSRDVHDIKCGKSRQLGISTFSRALSLFWNGIHDGLKGYMVFDTGQHVEEARLELVSMIRSLPDRVKFPRIERENRGLIRLENGSGFNFASAGTRPGKSSGTLGRSSGVNFVHGSECCSWDNVEGLEAFRNALAEDFPDRLYLWESTARGFNAWHEMWVEARNDPDHQKTIFIGWWAKDNQFIRRDHPDFRRYGEQPPSKSELHKIQLVREEYGWTITPEQLAWYRRKVDPTAQAEGDAPVEYEAGPLRVQEQPWTEDEMFQMTGATFFEPAELTHIANRDVSKKFKTYSYIPGIEFSDMRVFPAFNAKSVELKVWEEPLPDCIYVIGADPAFGFNEKNDRSAIQVMRCYADGLDQVAEYAWPLINSKHFAWVIASLLGWYGDMENNEVYFILELNGPGDAVWRELQGLKHHLQHGYATKSVTEKGLQSIFLNVRNYIYSRADSMSPGRAWHLKTTGPLKVSLMERLRDFVSAKMITIRSQDTLEEMKSITREGDTIEAQGSKKDDRVASMAFAVRAWEERVRRGMSSLKRTRENEAAKRRMTIKDQVSLFNGNQLEAFFKAKGTQRTRENIQLSRMKWRGRR